MFSDSSARKERWSSFRSVTFAVQRLDPTMDWSRPVMNMLALPGRRNLEMRRLFIPALEIHRDGHSDCPCFSWLPPGGKHSLVARFLARNIGAFGISISVRIRLPGRMVVD